MKQQQQNKTQVKAGIIVQSFFLVNDINNGIMMKDSAGT